MKEEVQRKYIEFQIVDQQIKQVQQQLVLLEQQHQELTALNESLGDLEKVKTNSKSFSSLGPGVFVESTINETGHVIMDVGAGVRVRKKISEAQKTVKEQIGEIEKAIEEMQGHTQKLVSHAQKLHNELQE